MSPTSPRPRPDQDPRIDRALNLASRFMALVRSGRAYSLEHVALTQQMEHYLGLLAPVLAEHGRACFDAPEGDLCLNGERLPFRQNMHRAIEQLVQELGARALAGIEFLPGLALPEFRSFMGLFLPGERWKGQDLIVACHDAGITRLRALPLRSVPVDRGVVAAADALSAALGPARETWTAFLAGTQQLLSGNALDHGVELRHVKRLAQPLVESVLAGERSVAALAGVSPGEPTWAHAAHTALVAVSLASRLALGRRDAIDVAVAALLHDVGHGWPGSAAT
ncbi:MAG TPA: HD domain-containing protein, partial [Candidatus Eisenbacteria bacterium]